jgi:putative DNA primase/helicase
MVGRGIYQRIGDATIHCRPFVLIVGKSGKARKGTAESTVREVFRRACGFIRQQRDSDERLRIHAGGLSTGEGVAWAVRDPKEADDNGKGGDVGISDKRLLVIEAEFDNLLSQLRRENNTLSATIRNLFDGRDLEPLTKTSQTRASKPHICIIGHITGHELREKSTENDAANGLMNRFMLLYVYRPKLVALPEPTPEERLNALAIRIATAVLTATDGDLHASNTREVAMSDTARAMWVQSYPKLTRDRDGKGGSLLARSEVYARMLAMIFASMDGRQNIEVCDLQAAVAWVEYWHDSITYVFNCADEESGLDEFTAKVLAAVTERPGITLTELQAVWSRKRIKEVKGSLEKLLNLAPPLVVVCRDDATGGRAALRYYTQGKR